ncbi:hypothetical protein RB2955 [Rhodopirellula baltica SH 1]|uniref:Uncharacterized protein n=1 Tax=Rhodopirellula baltica (strain DSM 10527 / NCIMB 13988 / SH1) TaxID=243090 RepID=Q7UV04_RHOBA|nr:hypothetical protein RB2955 [Rhodopirellula baltica SH 1]
MHGIACFSPDGQVRIRDKTVVCNLPMGIRRCLGTWSCQTARTSSVWVTFPRRGEPRSFCRVVICSKKSFDKFCEAKDHFFRFLESVELDCECILGFQRTGCKYFCTK